MGIYWDNGHILWQGGAIAWSADCCCSGAPCTDCTGAQGNAGVSWSGTCDAGCETAAGTYIYDAPSFTSDASGCTWVWWKGPVGSSNSWALGVTYTIATATWSGVLRRFLNIGMYQATGIATIACKGSGLLDGSFALNGNATDVPDCTGCTATVTL